MAMYTRGVKAGRLRPLLFAFQHQKEPLQEFCRHDCPLVLTTTTNGFAKRSFSQFVPCGSVGVCWPAKLPTNCFDDSEHKWIYGSANILNSRQFSAASNNHPPWCLRPRPSTFLQRSYQNGGGHAGGMRRQMGRESKLLQTSLKLKETKEKVKEKMEEIIDKENIFTIPNLLCVTRIGLSPVLGYLVLQHSYNYALGLFVFAGVTDLLDGLIARHFPSQQSMIGSFLDPMADKFLIALLFLSLTATDLIPVPLTALIIGRDLCLMYAGFYIRYLSLPPPKTFSRYFDATFATAKLSPTLISKINTSVQLTLVACTLAAPVFDLVNHPYLQMLWYVTAASTIFSGLSYVGSKDTFKLLREAKSRKTSGATRSDRKDI